MTFRRFMAAVAVVVGGFFFVMWLGAPGPHRTTTTDHVRLPWSAPPARMPEPLIVSPFERNAETTFTMERKP